MGKVFYVDLETTGTIPSAHAIVQLAALVEIDNTIEEELDLKMRPMRDKKIDPEALAVHNTTEEDLASYPHVADQFPILESTLSRYVNKYDKLDKFVLSGYNISAFDEPFLRQLFIDNAATRDERSKGGYFGSWFFWPCRDVQTYLAEHITEYHLRLKNYKLSTVCEHFNIPIDAHDALSDIKATRQLYRILRYSLSTAVPSMAA